MKTFAISFVTVVVIAGLLVGIGVMSGYLDFDFNGNVIFGVQNEPAGTQNDDLADIVITMSNDEPDNVIQVQIPPQKTIFWHRPPFKTIHWEPEIAEMPPITGYAEIDWDNMTKEIDWGDSIYYNPPRVYIPDPPIVVPIEPPIISPYPNPPIYLEPPPVHICDSAQDATSE